MPTIEQITSRIDSQVDAEGEALLVALRRVIAKALSVGTLLDAAEITALRDGGGLSGETGVLMQAVAQGTAWADVKANLPNYVAALEEDLRAALLEAVVARADSRDVIVRIREELTSPRVASQP